jgi:hypothetical protein
VSVKQELIDLLNKQIVAASKANVESRARIEDINAVILHREKQIAEAQQKVQELLGEKP